jgi:hypothetical protein
VGDFAKAFIEHRTNKALEQPEFNPNQAWSALNCRLKKKLDLLIFIKSGYKKAKKPFLFFL